MTVAPSQRALPSPVATWLTAFARRVRELGSGWVAVHSHFSLDPATA